jgi:hypothetical protein
MAEPFYLRVLGRKSIIMYIPFLSLQRRIPHHGRTNLHGEAMLRFYSNDPWLHGMIHGCMEHLQLAAPQRARNATSLLCEVRWTSALAWLGDASLFGRV